MSPSKILFFLCLSFVAGIFLESIVKTPQIFILGVLFLGFLAILNIFVYFCPEKCPIGHFSGQRDNIVIIGFCLLSLAIGVMRVQISEFNIANDKLSKFNGKGQVILIGTIFNESDVRDTYQKLKIKVGDSVILVTADRYPEYRYLDTLKVIGKLEVPMVTDTFNYKNYLMKDHIFSVMNFPKIELVSQKHQYNIFSFLYEKVLFCKEKIRKSIQGNFLPPHSSILEGTILGDNGAMTADLKNKLNITGLRHVIAVSGTHVVILSSIVMSLLLIAGLWRGQAFYIAIIFICIYIVLTGLPPSGVRAGIMGGIYLLSQKIGRQTMGSRLITLACSIMLLINPLLLLYDVGFQLSFLAVLGLIYLEPLIKNILLRALQFYREKLLPHRINDHLFYEEESKAGNIVGIFSTTFAAQIFTLPIMVYNFGNISFVSPITNLLITPIVYWLMVFGFLTSIAGIFSNSLGWILSIPCWFLLTYFIKVIDFFSQPEMAKSITNVSWVWVLVSYAVIGLATWFLNRTFQKNNFFV